MVTRALRRMLCVAALGACRAQGGSLAVEHDAGTAPPPAPEDSAKVVPAIFPSAAASASALVTAAAPVAPPPPPPRAGPPGDACRITRGPIQLSFTGPATLVPDAADGDPRIVFNRDGVPYPVTLPAARPSAARSGKPDAGARPDRLTLSEAAERAGHPACAHAGSFLFCLDRAGAIHRSSVTGEGSAVVAQARIGSPLSAASIAGNHVVYAFLADRKTSEGATTLAFAALDDTLPVVLSEDGAGATFLSLASRGEQAVAMYIDARRVLTPVHARVLSAAGRLVLGPDAVLFVGSGTDGRTPGAIAQGNGGHELALLPIDKDDRAFGMVSIRVDEQPRDDAAATWSLYPAAMERPAVAATRGVWPIRVLRTRPPASAGPTLAPDAGGAPAQSAAPAGDGGASAPKPRKVLELGELDGAGAFQPLCQVAEGTTFTDLAMMVDGAGALWIAYTDADGTWVERRGGDAVAAHGDAGTQKVKQ